MRSRIDVVLNRHPVAGVDQGPAGTAAHTGFVPRAALETFQDLANEIDAEAGALDEISQCALNEAFVQITQRSASYWLDRVDHLSWSMVLDPLCVSGPMFPRIPRLRSRSFLALDAEPSPRAVLQATGGKILLPVASAGALRAGAFVLQDLPVGTVLIEDLDEDIELGRIGGNGEREEP